MSASVEELPGPTWTTANLPKPGDVIETVETTENGGLGLCQVTTKSGKRFSFDYPTENGTQITKQRTLDIRQVLSDNALKDDANY